MPRLRFTSRQFFYLILICLTNLIDQFYPVFGVLNTTQISHILDQLTDHRNYDKRLRPFYGEKAVDIGITLHITSISAVSEVQVEGSRFAKIPFTNSRIDHFSVDMEFTLDCYMRKYWKDPRLAFDKIDTQDFANFTHLTLGINYLDRLWRPDTFFPNEKKSFLHMAPTPNSFLRIDPDGTVYTSQRLTVTAHCLMDLQLFPMDTQYCKLEIESYGYTEEDIVLYWGQNKTNVNRPPHEAVKIEKGIFLPHFKPTGYRVNISRVITASGEYTRLHVKIKLSRNMGFYTMNILVPSALVVSISWLSFWLNREASSERVGLGVITVLTMITMITTTNNSMPKVSYIKVLDIFLNFCLVMVTASLVEYAVVSYLDKKPKSQGTELPIYMYYQNYSPSNARSLEVYTASSQTLANRVPADQFQVTKIPAIQLHNSQSALPNEEDNLSNIDKYSRCGFPLIFILFNVVFWCSMSWISYYRQSQNFITLP